MSRPKRQTPVFEITTAGSEKRDRRLANRLLRRVVLQCVGHGAWEVLSVVREVSDARGPEKDQKGWGEWEMRK